MLMVGKWQNKNKIRQGIVEDLDATHRFAYDLCPGTLSLRK
jgi:hypothetical protein